MEEIIGDETIDGKLFYMMKWKPTLVAEEDAENAAQLITKWNLKKRKAMAKAKHKRQPRKPARRVGVHV